jgi:RNA polymerase sigma-70 factor (ECF subfamily)
MEEPGAHNRTDDEESQRFDADAVGRTLDGDMIAYDRLIEKYQRRAVSVAYRLLGDVNDAMDVAQDAFLRAFRSLGTLQEPQRFGAWLMRIVSNLSLNFRRGRKSYLSLSMGEDESTPLEDWALGGKGREQSGAEAIESRETQELVEKAIDSLPPQQKLALVLFAIEQMPQKQVAEIMECSVEMVKWNVFQARKALKAKLADYLEE